MLKPISAHRLKTGMYVVLPASWIKHPFLKNNFFIKTPEQINEIIESGFDEVSIDTSKSFVIEDMQVEAIGHGDKPQALSEKWEPEKLISEALREAVSDKSMPSAQKAKIIYNSSVNLMNRLIDSPTAQNIGEAKKGISAIVDLILSDDETTFYLLSITSHDFYTYTHSVNVGILSIALSKAVFKGDGNHNMHELGAGYFLHDIGKNSIAPAIINKKGKLTEEEMNQMRSHPYQGYKILSGTNHLTEECKVIVMQHHEREDGTGYPQRLKGDEIHAYGRICSIADVYDALTSQRSYKPSLAPFEALKVMKNEMLNHFHKDIFEKFVLLFCPNCI
ncbi:MAG: HD-GYP domain-containing protein [Nitrospirae bacterium]|nr:HD-GYP domain-containing protein [Nitrospirota bacterium]